MQFHGLGQRGPTKVETEPSKVVGKDAASQGFDSLAALSMLVEVLSESHRAIYRVEFGLDSGTRLWFWPLRHRNAARAKVCARP